MEKEEKLLTASKVKKMLPASKEEKLLAAPKVKKTGPGSNPVNKFKKGQTTNAATLDRIITSAVGKVKPQSGERFNHKGTVPDYEEER